MNTLLDVFRMDMAYFSTSVPVSTAIMDIMFGVGWALLLGNLVFQAARSMLSGIGFEGDDPRTLRFRTLIFAFLLVASRQICEIGLGLGGGLISLLQVPDTITLPSFTEDMFSIDASWFLMILIGLIVIFYLVKFFFEVGERYVIVAVLTILSPLAFSMGGSRSTSEIFKGWARMYGSMCLMMVMNVVFLKLIISAIAIYPRGLMVFPWLILVIALARVSRKIDNIMAKIGLNPAMTGDGLGRGFPGMMALMVGRYIASSFVTNKMGAGSGASGATKGAASGESGRPSGFSGGTRPAPSPINTGVAGGMNTSTSYAGVNPTSGLPFNPAVGAGNFHSQLNTGLAGDANTMNRANPVNPPLRGSGSAPQNIGRRTIGAQPSAVQRNPITGGRGVTGGIPVFADDEPSRKTTGGDTSPRKTIGSGSFPPQASPVRAAAPVQPVITDKCSGVMQAPSVVDKSAPPVSTQASIQTPAPVNPSAAPTRPNHSGQATPIQTRSNTQSVQQGSHAQVSAVSLQDGTQAQSQVHTTQQGANVQQNNSQSQTRAGSSQAQQPVQTQSAGSVLTGTASDRQTPPAPLSTAMQAGAAGKPKEPKSAAKSTPAKATQTPKEQTPVKLGKQKEQPSPVNAATSATPGAAGKSKPPEPIDIGTDNQPEALPNTDTEGAEAVTDDE